jgi:hypothetical protein
LIAAGGGQQTYRLSAHATGADNGSGSTRATHASDPFLLEKAFVGRADNTAICHTRTVCARWGGLFLLRYMALFGTLPIIRLIVFFIH